MSTLYEMQAARIEATLGAHKVPGRVWQATVTPRFVRFDVTTVMGTKVSRVTGLEDELAMALGASAVRINRDGGVLHIEVPRADAKRIVALRALLDKITTTIPPVAPVLGIDENGTPLILRLPSPDVTHVLIAGTTGSGKTELLRAMLASLVLRNRPGVIQLVLIDPKRDRLLPFDGLPQVRMLATDPDEAIDALNWTVEKMVSRQRGSLPHIIVAIDELADLLMTGGKPVEEAITRLTQRGREAGVHVIAATQRPAAALVGGMVKANFPVRLVGSVTSPEDAKVSAGIGGTGAERLLGRGDFLLICKGQVIRFQAAYASQAELDAIIGEIGRVEIRRPASGGVGSGVGSGVGISAPETAISAVSAVAHPTPPHPTRARSLRDRYTVEELLAFLQQAGGRLKEATELAFGYSDTPTLAIMRAAAGGER